MSPVRQAEVLISPTRTHTNQCTVLFVLRGMCKKVCVAEARDPADNCLFPAILRSMFCSATGQTVTEKKDY